MSEHDNGQVEQKSSVKLSLNAKGDCQVEVKCYQGTTNDEMEATRQLAISTFNETLKAVGR
jgi:phosphotransferase system HPr-like phosphotransfer protein